MPGTNSESGSRRASWPGGQRAGVASSADMTWSPASKIPSSIKKENTVTNGPYNRFWSNSLILVLRIKQTSPITSQSPEAKKANCPVVPKLYQKVLGGTPDVSSVGKIQASKTSRKSRSGMVRCAR